FQVWSIVTGISSREIEAQEVDDNSCTLSPGGKYLAFTGRGTLYIHDLSNAKLQGEIALPKPPKFDRFQGLDLAFSADGRELAGFFKVGQELRLLNWNVDEEGKLTANHKFPLG